MIKITYILEKHILHIILKFKKISTLIFREKDMQSWYKNSIDFDRNPLNF